MLGRISCPPGRIAILATGPGRALGFTVPVREAAERIALLAAAFSPEMAADTVWQSGIRETPDPVAAEQPVTSPEAALSPAGAPEADVRRGRSESVA